MYEFDEKYRPSAALGGAEATPWIPVGDASGSTPSAIPNFLTLPPVEDDATRTQLRKLIDLAGSAGWRAALEATYDAGMLKYVSDVARARFIDLLPLKSNHDVLEIGPGLGQFTALLAGRSRHVHALEVVPEQAVFTAIRARQQGATNVSVAVGGDDCRLPYRDASFDGVVLNLVFEWCGSRLSGESHEQVQMRLLAEMARVLKPGGFLYLSTKNRFALRLLLGGTDEHMFNLPFGSALPRRFGSWLSDRTGRARPMGMLHSHDGLRARLLAMGFAAVESFWAAPEMRFPRAFVPIDPASVQVAKGRRDLAPTDGRKVQWLMPLVPARWVRHVMPGLTFLAVRGPAVTRAGSSD